MQLKAERTATALIVRAPGPRIDAAGAIAFKDGMEAVTQDWSGRVVLDLAEVGFIDSSGLGAVVATMKALGPGRPLELAAPTPAVQRVLRLTRLDTVFRVHPTLAAVS